MLNKDKLNSKTELGLLIKLIAIETGFEIMHDYSGRGMYGKKCFGLIGDLTNMPKFFIMLAESIIAQDNNNDVFEIACLFENMQIDSMGMSKIIYFPNLVIANV